MVEGGCVVFVNECYSKIFLHLPRFRKQILRMKKVSFDIEFYFLEWQSSDQKKTLKINFRSTKKKKWNSLAKKNSLWVQNVNNVTRSWSTCVYFFAKHWSSQTRQIWIPPTKLVLNFEVYICGGNSYKKKGKKWRKYFNFRYFFCVIFSLGRGEREEKKIGKIQTNFS